MALTVAPEETIRQLEEKLTATETSLEDKYRALYALRGASNPSAVLAIHRALEDASDLFRHDAAFCLGQRQDPSSLDRLKGLLADAAQHPMVRHEAAEALGAIGTPECLAPLREHKGDPCQEVRETCCLAFERMEYEAHPAARPELTADENPYASVDPTPALPKTTPVHDLRDIALNEDGRLFDRYSAMFALRNAGGEAAVAALGALFRSSSALLKHEVAYILGQMRDRHAVEVLHQVLADGEEHPMVRHEAAEALGAIASPECLEALRQHRSDPEPIVADSCVVALDMAAFETSGDFQYADVCPGD